MAKTKTITTVELSQEEVDLLQQTFKMLSYSETMHVGTREPLRKLYLTDQGRNAMYDLLDKVGSPVPPLNEKSYTDFWVENHLGQRITIKEQRDGYEQLITGELTDISPQDDSRFVLEIGSNYLSDPYTNSELASILR